MPNYNKSFNFRNGVQVDVDDLIVRGNLVGIGTTIPRADLDVRGTVDVTGIITTTNIFVSGVSTFTDELRIGTGITISPQTGIISATFFRGDASQLANLPTSQWVDVDPGVGYTSIYNVGPVGIATTNPVHSLQVGADVNNGGEGVGINSRGHIRLSGIVTAGSFVGSGAGITAIEAQNITSGTLDAARLPSTFSGLSEVDTTNLVVSGVGTVGTLGVTTLSSGSLAVTNNTTVGGALTVTGTLVSGDATASALNVSGISTISQINVTGVATFRDSVTLLDNDRLLFGNNADLEIFHDTTNNVIQSDTGNLEINIGNSAGNLEINVNNNVSGGTKESSAKFIKNGAVELYYDDAKKFETLGIGATVTGDLKVSENATILGVSTLTSISASDATIGVATVTTLNATELNFTNISVSGVTTFSAAIDANAGATIDNVQIGVSDDNEIDTASGNLTIDSAGGTTTIDDDLTVTGNITATSNVVVSSDKNSGIGTIGGAFADAFIGEVTVGAAGSEKISTRNDNPLKLDSDQGTVIVEDDLNVTGVTTVTTFNATTSNVGTENVSTALNPSGDQTVPLGTNSLRFSELYVDNIRVGVGSDQEIIAASGNLELKAPGGNVRITNLEPVGIVTVGGDVLPDGDKTRDLGSSTAAYAEVHADELRIGVSPNTLDTRSGDLNLDSASGLTSINDDLTVTGSASVSTNAFIGVGGTGLAVLGSDRRIGIGTSAPSSSIQVVNYANADLRLISENASSVVTLSRDLTGATDDTATISYNGTDLTIGNKDAAGNVDIQLSAGTGINTTGDFKVTHKGSELFTVSHEGFIGVNNASPTKQLDVTGGLAVSGSAEIVGVLTVGQAGNQITLGTASGATLDVNVNSTGISTFSKLNATHITSENLEVTVGIATFQAGANIGTETAPAFSADLADFNLAVQGSAIFEKGVRIYDENNGSLSVGSTTIPSDSRSGIGNQRIINYGKSHVKGNVSFLGSTDGTAIFVAGVQDDSSPLIRYVDTQISENHTYQYTVGINTHVPRSCLDLGGSSSPLILPSMSTTALNNLVNSPSDATIQNTVDASGGGRQVPGGLFYDRQLDCVKVGVSTVNDANSFKRIIHVTMSGTIESIAFPQVSNANVTTLQNDSNIPDGAVVYNTGTNKLMVKASGTFTNLH